MKFDAYAVLAKLRADTGGRANRAKHANPPASISTNSIISTGPPAHIRQGVAEAFKDWEALNNPHDPKAWQ